jgi:Protein of unknown function (DUF3810)
MKAESKITVKALISLGLLLFPAILIFIGSFFSLQVEEYYSNQWYPAIGNTLRMITRNLPFSIGDIVYVLVGFSWMVSLIQWIINGFRMGFTLHYFGAGLLLIGRKLIWLYIIFKLIWGLNYDRMGIAYQLNLDTEPYQKQAVVQITKDLMDSLNACRKQLKDTILPEQHFTDINREAFKTYQNQSKDYPFLNYRNQTVKKSLYSQMGDFVGFTGYFNPFTGEAQVRSDIPRIMVPFITCHEMAHQLGYASESEANFVGYLTASNSKDVYFRYSVYLELFSYAQGAEILLYGKEKDFPAFEQMIKFNRSYLDSLVRKDRKEIRQFFMKRKNNISPAFNSLYDQYLKLNKQAAGIDSYDDVIAWLIAYKKKFGKI